jgi:hypothetical protein
MSGEIKKQPEEITDTPLPEPSKVLSESDLKQVFGGDGSEVKADFIKIKPW